MKQNRWVKSTRSGSNGACVEVMDTGSELLVRDSKDPESAVLRFTREEWSAFVVGVRQGEFTL